MVSFLAIAAAFLQLGYSWEPMDAYKIMDSGVTPSTKTVAEEVIFSIEVWGKDTDRWHRLDPNTNQEATEEREAYNIEVTRGTVNSGTPQGQMAHSRNEGGKVVYTSTIKARKIEDWQPNETARVYYDFYAVVDTLNPNHCQYDGAFEFQTPITIQRPPATEDPPSQGAD